MIDINVSCNFDKAQNSINFIAFILMKLSLLLLLIFSLFCKSICKWPGFVQNSVENGLNIYIFVFRSIEVFFSV